MDFPNSPVLPGVLYRTGLSEVDYDEAIQALQDAKKQASQKFAGGCAVCGDSGHTAEGCHHNPLVMARRAIGAAQVWRCYHCNAVFTDHKAAAEHFGASDREIAKCLTRQDGESAKSSVAVVSSPTEWDIYAPHQLGIDFVYVRDYPEAAVQWLFAARRATDIPSALKKMLEEPLAGHRTAPLPGETGKGAGLSCEMLFRWIGRLPGHDNDLNGKLGDERQYRSIVTYLDDVDEEWAASEEARRDFPDAHPFAIAARTAWDQRVAPASAAKAERNRLVVLSTPSAAMRSCPSL